MCITSIIEIEEIWYICSDFFLYQCFIIGLKFYTSIQWGGVLFTIQKWPYFFLQ